LFIGAGWVVEQCWLPACTDLDLGTIHLLDIEPERASRCAATFSSGVDVKAIESVRQREFDLAVVATPVAPRIGIARELVGRVGRIVLEKPAALAVEDLCMLNEVAAAAGVEVAVANTVAYRRDVEALVAACKAFELVEVDISWIRRGGVPRRPTFLDPRLSGGGALVDLGWHLLDVVHEVDSSILDDCRLESVDWSYDVDDDLGWQPADVRTEFGGVETGATLCALSATGVRLRLKTSWVGSGTYDYTCVRVADASGRSCVLDATFGFSPNRRPESTLSIIDAAGGREVRTFENSSEAAFREQARRLLDPGRSTRGSRHDAAWALGKVEMFELAYGSVRTGGR
jgi:oxidoreductase